MGCGEIQLCDGRVAATGLTARFLKQSSRRMRETGSQTLTVEPRGGTLASLARMVGFKWVYVGILACVLQTTVRTELDGWASLAVESSGEKGGRGVASSRLCFQMLRTLATYARA